MIGRRDYETRRAARIERLQARAAKVRAEGNARLAAADRIADAIPFGQPILVGHHSERRARRDRERIHNGLSKGFEALKHAKDLDRRAASAEENTAISSDDPEAVTRLREKLADLEAKRLVLKRINGAFKKGGLEALRQSEPAAVVEAVARRMAVCHYLDQPYSLTNTSAEIRRVKARIEELVARAARPAREPERYGDVTVQEEDNRVQIIFPGKPGDDVRTRLKREGFRWAPSAGAWQRHASNHAWYLARQIAGALQEAPQGAQRTPQGAERTPRSASVEGA